MHIEMHVSLHVSMHARILPQSGPAIYATLAFFRSPETDPGKPRPLLPNRIPFPKFSCAPLLPRARKFTWETSHPLAATPRTRENRRKPINPL
jgi:hypothetical protein